VSTEASLKQPNAHGFAGFTQIPDKYMKMFAKYKSIHR
jgi:hypothetical protein